MLICLPFNVIFNENLHMLSEKCNCFSLMCNFGHRVTAEETTLNLLFSKQSGSVETQVLQLSERLHR